jgi:hypothetical protein
MENGWSIPRPPIEDREISEGHRKRVSGTLHTKPQRDVPVFSKGIEGLEVGRDVSVVCGDDGDRRKRFIRQLWILLTFKHGGMNMLDTIVGDVVGSRFEWNNHKGKNFDFLTY